MVIVQSVFEWLIHLIIVKSQYKLTEYAKRRIFVHLFCSHRHQLTVMFFLIPYMKGER